MTGDWGTTHKLKPRSFIKLYSTCYESPKKEQVSYVFKHLIANIKLYNVDKI